MKTQILNDGDKLIVKLEGYLDFESADTFRSDLTKIYQENVTKKFIFDFHELHFVGSSGISAFIQVLREFNTRTDTQPVYCNVKSEFKKMIEAFDENKTFIFDSLNNTKPYKIFNH